MKDIGQDDPLQGLFDGLNQPKRPKRQKRRDKQQQKQGKNGPLVLGFLEEIENGA
jgi:hypothetical protein